jgi:hypothetical protein
MLTEKDKGFIFHEPRFGDGWWQFEHLDRSYLRTWGWDPPKFANIGNTWAWFMDEKGLQIGAKEIRNMSSSFYYDCWHGNMRFVVSHRDPADIYLSAYKMFTTKRGNFTWRPMFAPFSPMGIYRELMPEVKHINNLWNMLHPLCRKVVTYEGICHNSAFQDDLYKFCESDITNPDIGGYHGILERGVYENDRHGGEVTLKSVRAIDTFDNSKVVADARKFRDLIIGKMDWLK